MTDQTQTTKAGNAEMLERLSTTVEQINVRFMSGMDEALCIQKDLKVSRLLLHRFDLRLFLPYGSDHRSDAEKLAEQEEMLDAIVRDMICEANMLRAGRRIRFITIDHCGIRLVRQGKDGLHPDENGEPITSFEMQYDGLVEIVGRQPT